MSTLPTAHAADWTPVLIASEHQTSPTDLPAPTAWENPLQHKGYLGSPLVEVTPFVWQERLYRLENWQKFWELGGVLDVSRNTFFQQDEVRILDVERDNIVSTPLTGFGFGIAFVWQKRVHVFAGKYGEGAQWRKIKEVVLTTSDDMRTWTPPQTVLRAEGEENLFNVAVCRANDRFVLLYETDDAQFPPFTFKFCESKNLTDWKLIQGAVYGREKYVGGPALYYEGDTFYTLYLQDMGGKWETRVSRSKDLLHWQDAPDGRPFVTFDPSHQKIPLRPEAAREINASDAELVFWQGKTLVYFTGSDQQVAGDLQWAEYSGTPRDLLQSFYAEPKISTPSPKQLAYQSDQLGTFIHFGPATLTGNSDMLVTPDAKDFNPVQLDAQQWCRAAKAMGAKRIVFTTKHHNGFCLWPTATTEYSVAHSPYKNGQGDIVREFVMAARQHGLKVGFYFSLGDKYAGCWSTPEPQGQRHIVGDRAKFTPLVLAQLKELLSNYGALDALWFDGAYDPFGWDVMDANDKPLGTQDGQEIVDLVRKLQPEACIFGGVAPDGRWSGTEEGWASDPLWNVTPEGQGLVNWVPPTSSGWHYVEALLYTRATWFWTPNSDNTLRSLEYLKSVYHASVGRGANLLMNLTPDTRGLIPDAEVARLKEFGAWQKQEYSQPIAQVDGDGNWDEGHTLELALPLNTKINRVVIEEDLKFGQRIRAHRIEIWRGAKWESVADSTSIGRQRIHQFAPVEATKLRLKVLRCDGLPEIEVFAAFATT